MEVELTWNCRLMQKNVSFILTKLKDGAPVCYCAHLWFGPRYLGFLRNLPTNTIVLIFFTVYEADHSKGYQKKMGGNHAFFREN